MKNEKNMFSIRTDLAIESREMLDEKDDKKLSGIEVRNEKLETMNITHVKILDDRGSSLMGRPKGNYITIESDKMKVNDVTCHEKIIEKLSECIRDMAGLKKDALVLVAGLGNWNITPDALGPKVISRVLVTRHVFDSLPEELNSKVRPVAAISPGVMGVTGIETGEIIKGLVKKLKPDLIIAVDALAARKFSRINAAIQMSDTGVCPGSGVGNRRMELSCETLGVPVIAIGVPTVVDAATLVNDTMDMMLSQMIESTPQGSEFYEMLKSLNDEEKYQLILDILNPYEGNMFVTPKEVDAVIDRLSNIIANAVNIALHEGISLEDINRFNI